jgi:hypothetical protein
LSVREIGRAALQTRLQCHTRLQGSGGGHSVDGREISAATVEAYISISKASATLQHDL